MNDTNDTNVYVTNLNNSDTIFIIGDTPTVTFNNNVTVYSYPKQEYKFVEDTIRKDENITKNNKINNRIKLPNNKLKTFFIKLFK